MYRVTRNVGKDEKHNYAGRDVFKGETLFRFIGCSYGCVDTHNGVVASEKGTMEYPFFEFPRDAVELI